MLYELAEQVVVATPAVPHVCASVREPRLSHKAVLGEVADRTTHESIQNRAVTLPLGNPSQISPLLSPGTGLPLILTTQPEGEAAPLISCRPARPD